MSRWLIDPVNSSRRSASVDFPWSMWAMMQKFRTSACLVVTATVRMLGIVALVLVLGVLLTAAGIVLLWNFFGAADYVIRHVTSKPLGSLAPGFAASRRGFSVYATLVLSFGVFLLGAAAAQTVPWIGLTLLFVSIASFGIASAIAIRYEIETYRALKR